MSAFVTRVNDLSSTFRLSQFDRIKLLAHYPFFKLAWHSTYGSSWRKDLAQKLMPVLSKRSTSFIAKGKDGNSIRVPISFQRSDLSSFEEIFFGLEYAPPVQLNQCKTYVDLGANTGMAALYFLVSLNLERLILVEANPALIPVLERNLATEQKTIPKIKIEHGYISGTDSGAVEFFAAEDHRMSSSTALQSSGSGKVVSLKKIPLRSLLDAENLKEVDILKMDIEGGEYSLMEEDPQVFTRFKNIFAEIHGEDESRKRIINQIANLGFEILRNQLGEAGNINTIYARRKS